MIDGSLALAGDIGDGFNDGNLLQQGYNSRKTDMVRFILFSLVVTIVLMLTGLGVEKVAVETLLRIHAGGAVEDFVSREGMCSTSSRSRRLLSLGCHGWKGERG